MSEVVELDQRRPVTLVDRLLTRTALASLPKPSPLIDRTLDLNTVAVLAGHFGTLKSFIGQDWAASVAVGRNWMGRTTEPRRVLYIAAEGAAGLDARFASWEVGWRRTIGADDLVTLPVAVQFGSTAMVAELAALVEQYRFGLVVVDTLAKCMVGLDENSAQDMGRVVSNLYNVQAATLGGTVVALHHTGKDRTTIRGSSALEAGVDTVYTTDGDSQNLTLSRTKRKDGPAEDIHRLKLKLVPYTDSGVIVSTTGADTTPSEDKLMSVYLSAFAATGCSKSELRGAALMANATFHRSLNGLVKAGLLVNTGTDARPFYKGQEA